MKIYAVLLSLVLVAGNAMAGDLPDTSVYQLNSTWKTQTAKTVSITELAGRTQIMAFVYTYCEHTCPIIVAKLQSIDAALPADLKAQTHITLVSLDPNRDTPEVLQAYMKKHELDESRWTMLSGDKDSVQELAAVLGTRYRPMGQDDIAHSNTLTILNQSGEMVYQSKGISEPVDKLIEKIRKSTEKNK